MHRIESPLAMDKMDAEFQECPAPMPTAEMDDSKSSHASDDGLDGAGTKLSPQQSDDKLAKKETRAVMWMRLGLTVILIAAALVVSLSVFFYSRNTETKTFESAVADSSIKIIESFQSVAEQRLGAMASMAVMITSHALSTNGTWPFVTVPNFEAQGWHALALMDAEGLIFSPIVSHQDRAEWENNYAPEHIAWVNESKAYQDSINFTYVDVNPGGTRTRDRNLQEPEETSRQNTTTEAPQEPPNNIPDFSLGYSKEIYAIGPQGVVVSPEKEKYMAWWQRVPGTISGVNMDINIDPTVGGDLLSVMERGHVGLGTMTLTAYGEFGAPVSGFYYPVLQELHHSAPAVASLGTQIFWDSFLTDILPESINGLYVVLSNTCDQQFTFMLNGPSVQNIGEGDLHDPDFDEYKEEASFTDLVSAGAEAGNYLGVEIDQSGCQYSLAVYPSSQMQDGYMTSQPVVLLISALFIFLVTSLTFLLYDHLVERRQKLVTQEAKKSGAIVDSLFPEAYRDRLMQAEEDKLKEQNSKNKKIKVSRVTSAKTDPSQLITNFMKNSDTNSAAFLRENGQDEDDDEPIADLYQDCTVFFADIAGFTAWSSVRCPSDVFRLLGTVYGAFDKLAERRGVFKVETIGDSYMYVHFDIKMSSFNVVYVPIVSDFLCCSSFLLLLLYQVRHGSS